MRLLQRPDRPADLTETTVQRLTSEFLLDPTRAVWRRSSIESALLAMTSHKCAYCEANLGIRSMYMEVDHFFHKQKYPERVLDWSNLMPSCKHCNTSKGHHDVGAEPIIDPTATDPRHHMRFLVYRFRGLDEIGRSTIEVLDLNDSERNVKVRFNVGETIHTGMISLRREIDSFELSRTVRKQNRLLAALRQLLREAGPTSEYGSTAATVLFLDPDFAAIRQSIESFGLWDLELETLFQAAHAIAYNPRARDHGGTSPDPRTSP